MVKAVLVSMLAIICVAAAFGPVLAASVRDAYFSKGELVRGQYYRSTGELPGPTKEFSKETDKVARLFIIFGDLQAHKVSGALKAADGRVVSRLNRDWPSWTGPVNVSWRVFTHAFNIERLTPGEYQLELLIDDASQGTYALTLR